LQGTYFTEKNGIHLSNPKHDGFSVKIYQTFLGLMNTLKLEIENNFNLEKVDYIQGFILHCLKCWAICPAWTGQDIHKSIRLHTKNLDYYKCIFTLIKI
jgi:hypothetical protein